MNNLIRLIKICSLSYFKKINYLLNIMVFYKFSQLK